ncbi:hypothetical protein ASPCAL08362 [Aspergillus calidoustus]|uniref:F-box domain protein n=1 Tax=Aspergillus calidoustus TaxID=454130 RepID=A0A0U5CQF4_ASPCI|nr:hypothetical protein ASPCAL08362 [Aspergillus calidoustus]
MLFLKVVGIPVESLDLHTVDFWELESAGETFPKQNRIDRVFPSPSRNKRTRPAPWAHLQSLALTNILHIDHGARFANLLASARALKSLKLAGVPDGFSFKVLSSCANRFQLERLEISGMHRTPIQMPAFLNALRKHRRTLRKLALSDSTLHDHARWSEIFRTLRQGGFSALQEFSMERLFEGPDHLGVSYIPGTMIVDGPKGAVLSWTLHHQRHQPNNNHNGNGNGNGTNPGALPNHRVYYGAIGYSGPGVWRLFRRLEERAVRRDPRDYSPSVPVIQRF